MADMYAMVHSSASDVEKDHTPSSVAARSSRSFEPSERKSLGPRCSVTCDNSLTLSATSSEGDVGARRSNERSSVREHDSIVGELPSYLRPTESSSETVELHSKSIDNAPPPFEIPIDGIAPRSTKIAVGTPSGISKRESLLPINPPSPTFDYTPVRTNSKRHRASAESPTIGGLELSPITVMY